MISYRRFKSFKFFIFYFLYSRVLSCFTLTSVLIEAERYMVGVSIVVNLVIWLRIVKLQSLTNGQMWFVTVTEGHISKDCCATRGGRSYCCPREAKIGKSQFSFWYPWVLRRVKDQPIVYNIYVYQQNVITVQSLNLNYQKLVIRTSVKVLQHLGSLKANTTITKYNIAFQDKYKQQ